MTEGSNEAYIGEGLTLFGSVTGGSDMAIDGKIEGTISLRGHVRLGARGVIRGPLEAERATIHGRMFGDVTVTDAIHIGRGGVVRGDVRAPRASLDEGGTLDGELDMELDIPEFDTEPPR